MDGMCRHGPRCRFCNPIIFCFSAIGIGDIRLHLHVDRSTFCPHIQHLIGQKQYRFFCLASLIDVYGFFQFTAFYRNSTRTLLCWFVRRYPECQCFFRQATWCYRFYPVHRYTGFIRHISLHLQFDDTFYIWKFIHLLRKDKRVFLFLSYHNSLLLFATGQKHWSRTFIRTFIGSDSYRNTLFPRFTRCRRNAYPTIRTRISDGSCPCGSSSEINRECTSGRFDKRLLICTFGKRYTCRYRFRRNRFFQFFLRIGTRCRQKQQQPRHDSL